MLYVEHRRALRDQVSSALTPCQGPQPFARSPLLVLLGSGWDAIPNAIKQLLVKS